MASHGEDERKGLRAGLAACRAAGNGAEQAGLAWAEALESVRDAVFLHDRDGYLLYANRAYLMLAGKKPGDALGRPYWEVFPRGDGPLASCRASLREGGMHEEEVRDVRGRVLRSRSFTVADDRGYRCSVHVMEDVTGSRRAEADLRRANEDLESFAYVAAHDLKAPLRAVHMLSELLEEQEAPHLTTEGRQVLGLLRARVHLMDELIEGLLAYSRAGGPPAPCEEVDSGALLTDLAAGLPIPAGFHLRWDPQMPRLQTDRLGLRQVFAQLIDNAVRHHDRREGHVYVSAEERDEHYAFAVSDDGPGIPPEYRRRIFDLFQHGPKTDAISTGIGLAVVRKIVERFGGRVELLTAEPRGTTFRFTWPKDWLPPDGPEADGLTDPPRRPTAPG